VLEKIGMQQEGRLREHKQIKGQRWDSLIYSILRQEWSPPRHKQT
jgi:RimJ/RimL family protein N-acetyltransferase